jgi:hypothetical protein
MASRNKVFPLVVVLLAAIIAGGIGYAWLRYYKSEQLDQKLEKMAVQMNRDNPKVLDPDTRLDKVTTSDGKFIYNYTLLNVTNGELDFETLAPKLKAQFAKRLCATTGWKNGLLEEGARVEYFYSGSDGKPIGRVTVTKSDCS